MPWKIYAYDRTFSVKLAEFHENFANFYRTGFLLKHLRLTTSAAFLVFLFSFYFFNSTSKILVNLVTLALRVANLTQKPVQRFLSYLWKWLKADKNIMLVTYNDTTKGHSSLWNMGLGWKLNFHNEHQHFNICTTERSHMALIWVFYFTNSHNLI